jgi:hypothetical protein
MNITYGYFKVIQRNFDTISKFFDGNQVTN